MKIIKISFEKIKFGARLLGGIAGWSAPGLGLGGRTGT